MAKPRKNTNMELDQIEGRLLQQDKVLAETSVTLKEILLTLKGSAAMGLEGLMPTIDRLESSLTELNDSMRKITNEVAHLMVWKERLQSGQISLNVPTVINNFFRFLGWIVAAVISIYSISKGIK